MFAPGATSRLLAPLDAAGQRRHKLRNLLQSALLLAGMVGLLTVCGWLLFGPDGILGVALGAALALVFGRGVSPRMVLRAYGARTLVPDQLPAVFDVLGRLTGRAGLARTPRLFYIRSVLPNAFAVGDREDAVIALTDGMLRRLDLRELAGVLAHEISHIRNRDLWLMSLADLTGRLTRVMTLLGLGLLVVDLPLWLGGRAHPPALLIVLLLLAPQLTMLLQLALSRAREFEADLDAVGLTGDPAAMISALVKLEHAQQGLWEQILMPGYRLSEPSLLRSHPPTAERIARLEALYGRAAAPSAVVAAASPVDFAGPAAGRRRHGRLLGYWR